MDKSIIILERRLFSAIGHERTQINAINDLIGNKKSIVISCKNINLDRMPFDNKVISELPRLNLKEEGEEPVEYIHKSGNALIKILEEHSLKQYNKIIIPSARRLEIALITYLYSKNIFPKLLIPLIRIHDVGFIENLPKPLLIKFTKLVNEGCIKLFTETEELSTKIKNDLGIMCSGDLVLPVSIHCNFKVHTEIKKKSIYIGCLGGPRRSKGIFIIPKIIKELRKHFRVNKEDFEITFIIQLSKDKNKRTFLFKANEFLSRYISNSVKVKYVFGAEDNQEFIFLLKSIDIFLLPYSNIQYKYTGSGFITDAIFLEKPIINRKGTSMKDLVRFENAISVENVSEYSAAIIKISKNYEYYIKNSKVAKKYLKEKIIKSFNAFLK